MEKSNNELINEITFDEWKKLNLKVGQIIEVEKVPKTEKLYRIIADLGNEKKQIVSSLAPYYSEKELLGKKIVVLTNLKPAKFAGLISEAMLLCAETDDSEKCVLLTVEKEIENGTKIT